ncbi:TIR domain-containing protein [Pseudoalteromonas sp. S16_S37]|uniref:TIR domain-containing protein n=1 Tax=Pseudoalteromonas sp. S16_S37 TaxID=2720228 RepID=UPI0016805F27|nr:TIR domain-containing protein [Pseudoalteromonas sp. S16_S37]MBD1582877.1 TIR domain-containing protein [Pseudoalteromonas sp. S16_S37]
MARHKCFISYHKDDEDEVNEFIRNFDHDKDVFITRGIGEEMPGDVINSDDPDYVMKRIRELYLKDSTVTLVMLGKCTWSRKYVDWELQSSLRNGETVTANGLLGIKLPSYSKGDGYPNRLNLNLKQDDSQEDCYARTIDYPKRKDTLTNAIDEAFDRRKTHTKWINNPRDKFKNNRSCC